MPGDTIHINNRASARNTYDAIVVGSGISGGWAAKELCEKGLKVLLLDRGRNVEHGQYPTATKDPWDFPHRLSLSREDKKKHPVQSRHWSLKEDNKHFYIDDLANPYEEIKRFDWIRGDVVGGRSLLWSRACYRWSDIDFGANARDGHGTDWPIRYKDVAAWYDYVESFTGVSGSVEGLEQLPDGKFLPPFELNCVEKDFKARVEPRFPNRKVIIGRSANLTRAIPGRGQCQARDLCHRGCPYGGYFSSNSATLPAAHATGNLTILPLALVNRVLYDENKKRATGVEVLHIDSNKTENYYSRIVFVNASTIGTAFILLNSTSHRFPTGLGNDSDQLGRNLMDHHKGISVSADVEGFEEGYYYGRRPVSMYIPRFQNLHRQEEKFLRGYHLAGSAFRGRHSPADVIGAEMKSAMSEPARWAMSLYAFGETLPYSDNRIMLSKDKMDPWGRPQLAIDCDFRENENLMHVDAKAKAAELLDAAGYKNIQVSGEITYPGNANHEMGIARMGKDPKTSVLNANNQMHAVPNLFVTDGSCMASGSCVNPSLTYMAITARACDYAVAQMKKGNI